MKKIIAIVLLLGGLSLDGLFVYGYFYSEDQADCDRYHAEARAKLIEADAAQGTPRGDALLEEARDASSLAQLSCGYARRTRWTGILMGLGGVILTIGGVVLFIKSPKRSA